MKALSEKSWNHPITGKSVSFSFSTIEEWYYQAKGTQCSPVNALKWKLREDMGIFRAISDAIKKAINKLHQTHPGWSHKWHYDNLLVIATQDLSFAIIFLAALEAALRGFVYFQVTRGEKCVGKHISGWLGLVSHFLSLSSEAAEINGVLSMSDSIFLGRLRLLAKSTKYHTVILLTQNSAKTNIITMFHSLSNLLLAKLK
ncbi:MAG: hypothetical protein HQM08_24960 [Candidatus Riflebacteria bacterium]|nr:hypothetical protein [Candidatus Riflebacteria bacterium]